MTVSCPQCGHMWSIDLRTVSQELRNDLANALRNIA